MVHDGFMFQIDPADRRCVAVKPSTKSTMSNMVVRTETGFYNFMLKENPWRPFDQQVFVGDPYRDGPPDSTTMLIVTAVTGVRIPELQYTPVTILTPETVCAPEYDPVARIAVSATLRRAVLLPRERRAVYWIRLENTLPVAYSKKMPAVHPATWTIDESRVMMYGLQCLAIPGTPEEAAPILGYGNGLDLFLVANHEEFPKELRVRFALVGSQTVEHELVFSMEDLGKKIGRDRKNVAKPAALTADEKLKAMYDAMIRDKKMETLPYPGATNPTEPKPEGSGGEEGAPGDSTSGGESTGTLFPPLDPEKKE